jgi:RND family efflux transporter MFP subunit
MGSTDSLLPLPRQWAAVSCLLLALIGGSAVSAAPAHEALGTTEAVRAARLALTVSGRIANLHVKVGARVSQGQLLLNLDSEAEALELKRRLLLLHDQSQIKALRERRDVTQAQVDAARDLESKGAIARKLMEDEALALRVITAELDALQTSKLREQVEVDMALEAWTARHLYAPFAGVVTKVRQQVGEILPANEPAIDLVDVLRVRFIGGFDQTLARAPRLGQTVTVILPTHPQIKAQVVFVSPVADPSSGLVEVIAEFANPEADPVRPGLGGRMIWEPGE